MAEVDPFCFGLDGGVAAETLEGVEGVAAGGGVVDDGCGVVVADAAVGADLEGDGHEVRLSDPRGGDALEFGDPLADEVAVGVVGGGLFGWGVDAERVDAGGAALHLELGEVDAWFEVEEVACEEDGGGPPVEPEVIGGEGGEHGAHAEVDPAGGFGGAHAGIDHGEAGEAFGPCGEAIAALRGGSGGFAEIVVAAVEVMEFEGGFVFEFLDEVAVPAETGGERAEGVAPWFDGRVGGVRDGLEVMEGGVGLLDDGAEGESAPCEVGAETGAGGSGGERTAHAAAVVDAAVGEEGIEGGEGVGGAAELADFGGRREAEIVWGAAAVAADAFGGGEGVGGWEERLAHAGFPEIGPAVAGAEPSEDPVLGEFGPWDAMGLAPCGDGAVAGERPVGPGFLV